MYKFVFKYIIFISNKDEKNIYLYSNILYLYWIQDERNYKVIFRYIIWISDIDERKNCIKTTYGVFFSTIIFLFVLILAYGWFNHTCHI